NGTTFTFNNAFGLTGQEFAGSVAEIILVSGNINTGDDQQVMSYLAARYGIVTASVQNTPALDVLRLRRPDIPKLQLGRVPKVLWSLSDIDLAQWTMYQSSIGSSTTSDPQGGNRATRLLDTAVNDHHKILG